MKKDRSVFYLALAVVYPVFFLLHWNGLFSITYYWALVLVGGTRSFLPQVVFAFLSSAVIFGGIILLFEATRAIVQRLHVT